MPELPEVEFGRKLAESVAVGRRVAKVRCARDPIVLDGVTGPAVRRALTGRAVRAVCRHGKQLWLELDQGPALLVHFGMTGALRVPAHAPLALASSRRQPETGWPPRFLKLLLRFDDGGQLAFTNKRRLGRIRLRSDPRGEPPVSKLGFDPLSGLPTPTAFVKLARRRDTGVKALLLDQHFSAGVGNWIADEVLYQARIDPRRRVPTLTDAELRRVRAKLGHVIRKAVSVDADKHRFPKSWLFHRRWGKALDARTARGEPVEHLKVAGRTTAWVPAIQR